MNGLKLYVVAVLFGGLILGDPAAAQPPDVAPQPMPQIHGRGLVLPDAATLKASHAAAVAKHGGKVQALPVVTVSKFDCRDMGWTVPVQDQGQCGACWDVAGNVCVSSAHVKAGYAKPTEFLTSSQFILDCTKNGGCNGDWVTTVLDRAKSGGLPLEKDYGPYLARTSTCKPLTGKTYTCDYGYCTPAQQAGAAATQDIKNCLVAYGMITTAISANSDWDNVSGGVIRFRSVPWNQVNHQVNIVAFDDAKVVPGAARPGAFLIQNQWSTSWGDKGFAWVGYGSHQVGFEAIFVTVPPPPNPDPKPDPKPDPTSGFSGVVTHVYVNGALRSVTQTPQAKIDEALKSLKAAVAAGGKDVGAFNWGELLKNLPAIIALVEELFGNSK